QAEAAAGVSSSRSARPVSAKNASARLGRTSAISRTSPPARSAAARITGTVAVSATLTVVSAAEDSPSVAPTMPASHPGGSGRAPRGLPPPEPERAREEAQVLVRAERGVDRHLLRDEAERAARAGGAGREGVAGHGDPPRIETKQRRQHAERRRLAGAVGT